MTGGVRMSIFFLRAKETFLIRIYPTTIYFYNNFDTLL